MWPCPSPIDLRPLDRGLGSAVSSGQPLLEAPARRRSGSRHRRSGTPSPSLSGSGQPLLLAGPSYGRAVVVNVGHAVPIAVGERTTVIRRGTVRAGAFVLDVGDAVAVEVEGRRRLGEADVVEARGLPNRVEGARSPTTMIPVDVGQHVAEVGGGGRPIFTGIEVGVHPVGVRSCRPDGELVLGPRIGIRRRLGRWWVDHRRPRAQPAAPPSRHPIWIRPPISAPTGCSSENWKSPP